MNENLNLIEILKNCPIGTKFYSSYLGKDVFFIGIYYNCIKCEYTSQIDSLNSIIQFRKDGSLYIGGECMLLPSKDQRDWSKWHRPFVDGDVVYAKVYDLSYIIIYHKQIDERVYRHACLCLETDMFGCDKDCIFTDDPIDEWRLATEEEKQKLFDTLKAKGYKWNPETKTLEKLIVPKFKVGDSIQSKTDNNDKFTITNIDNDKFYYGCGKRYEFMIPVEKQDNWELVPNKFNPNTLQHFDKVLMTDSLSIPWTTGFFSYIKESEEYRFVVGASHWRYCIPYNNDTKYLVGKTGEAPEFYRYWEE